MYFKLNNINDEPTSKTQLTKEWMGEYVLAKGNAEQIATCVKYLTDKSTYKEGTNNLTGEKITKVDLVSLRNWFCQEFFPILNEKKNNKKTTKAPKTIEERLQEALEKKAGN